MYVCIVKPCFDGVLGVDLSLFCIRKQTILEKRGRPAHDIVEALSCERTAVEFMLKCCLLNCVSYWVAVLFDISCIVVTVSALTHAIGAGRCYYY